MKFIILTRPGGARIIINADRAHSLVVGGTDGTMIYFSHDEWEIVAESIDEIATMLEIKLPENSP